MTTEESGVSYVAVRGLDGWFFAQTSDQKLLNSSSQSPAVLPGDLGQGGSDNVTAFQKQLSGEEFGPQTTKESK